MKIVLMLFSDNDVHKSTSIVRNVDSLILKLKNGISEKLYWIEPNPLQQLQNVLDQQARKVILTTPRLLVN